MKLPRSFYHKHAALKMRQRYWELQLLKGRHDTYAVEQYLLLTAELEAKKEEEYEAILQLQLQKKKEAQEAAAAAARSKEWIPTTTLTFD